MATFPNQHHPDPVGSRLTHPLSSQIQMQCMPFRAAPLTWVWGSVGVLDVCLRCRILLKYNSLLTDLELRKTDRQTETEMERGRVDVNLRCLILLKYSLYFNLTLRTLKHSLVKLASQKAQGPDPVRVKQTQVLKPARQALYN